MFAVDWPRAAPYHARIPTRVERQRLLAAAEPFLRPLILIGMYTGLRKGSILRLEAENYLSDLQMGGYPINGHKSAQEASVYVYCGEIPSM